jgi:hypothetical protein
MAADPLPQIPMPAEAAAAPMSEGARILNTYIAPSKTFTDLRRNASWWGPWVLISIFSLAVIFTVGKKIGFEQVTRNQLAQSARSSEQFDKLTPEQQAQRLQFSAKIFSYIGYATPLVILLVFLIMATALWATFNIGAGAETSFSQAYAIVMYASLPGVIHAILSIVSMVAGTNPEGFDINNAVGTNLGYFLDPESVGKFVRVLASSLDVINIWTIILIGIGFACTSKVKRSTAIMIVAGWYVLAKLVAAGFAAMG